jgi:hypothetical protein
MTRNKFSNTISEANQRLLKTLGLLPDKKSKTTDVELLIHLAENIGLDVNKADIEKDVAAFNEFIEFQYRWRSKISEFSLLAGGLKANLIPEMPFTPENIGTFVDAIQPKIKSTKRKSMSGLGVLIVLPLILSGRCVIHNQQLLEEQNIEISSRLGMLQEETQAQGWQFTLPDPPLWKDVKLIEEQIKEHSKNKSHAQKINQRSKALGLEFEVEKPYLSSTMGDYSYWLDLDVRLNPIPPFSFLKVLGGPLVVSEESISIKVDVTHDFWVMKSHVSPELMAYIMGPSFVMSSTELSSWEDAIVFANTFSEHYKLTPCYLYKDQEWTVNSNCDGFRLPTEVEWLKAVEQGQDGRSTTIKNTSTNGFVIHIEPDWCWDVYDPTWLWNLDSKINPRVDSASVAETERVLRSHPDLRLHQVPNTEAGRIRLLRVIRP